MLSANVEISSNEIPVATNCESQIYDTLNLIDNNGVDGLKEKKKPPSNRETFIHLRQPQFHSICLVIAIIVSTYLGTLLSC